MEVRVGDGVGDGGIPCDALCSLPWNEGQPARSFQSVRDSPGGSRTIVVLALISARYNYDIVEFVMSYGSASAPLAREAVRTSCVDLFATRALVRLAEAGAETKTHSNSDCLVVEPQHICLQRESVEPITAVGCRCGQEPSSVDVVCEGRHDDGFFCHYLWSVRNALVCIT